MNKKILATGLLVSVLTVTGFAHGGDNDQNGGMMMGQQQSGQYMNQRGYMQTQQGRMNQRGKMLSQGRQGMMGSQQGMMSKRGMMSMMGSQAKMMNMFQNLNLNETQKYKISILRDEMRLEMRKQMGPNQRKNMFNFITNKGFNKAAFKKQMEKMHDKILNLKADNLEKMFKVLTKEQIAQLKKNITK